MQIKLNGKNGKNVFLAKFSGIFKVLMGGGGGGYFKLTLVADDPPPCSHSLEVLDRPGAEAVLVSTDYDVTGTAVETAG